MGMSYFGKSGDPDQLASSRINTIFNITTLFSVLFQHYFQYPFWKYNLTHILLNTDIQSFLIIAVIQINWLLQRSADQDQRYFQWNRDAIV